MTSIHALSAEDCDAFTSLSSCVSFSLSDLETSGVARKEAVGEEAAKEARVCCAERRITASRLAPSTSTWLKLHFHPTHFIDVSAPLLLYSTSRDPPPRL